MWKDGFTGYKVGPICNVGLGIFIFNGRFPEFILHIVTEKSNCQNRNSTEIGQLYPKAKLIAISGVCDVLFGYLFVF